MAPFAGSAARRSPEPRAGGLAATAGLALVLAGCSGTRFGDQLARSFSSSRPSSTTAPAAGAAATPARAPAPGASPAGTPPRAGAPSTGSGAAASSASVGAAAQALPGKGPTPASPAAVSPAGRGNGAPAQPLSPAPYRVTIKLPGADPSAPAEVVTRALRAAGVSFEVETIERIAPATGPSPAPVATPAPPPR